MEFCFEQVVPALHNDVFAFHADPGNLVALHRSRWGFRLLHHDGDVRPGCATWVQELVAGIVPVVLGFRHTTYEPPHRFGEELFHGPYETFVHTHEFETVTEGTLVRDRLLVRWPWQYGGAAVMRTLVASRIREAFAARQRTLRALVDDGTLVAAAARR
jgi:ligand-binding SRPBCC domain-containing protein